MHAEPSKRNLDTTLKVNSKFKKVYELSNITTTFNNQPKTYNIQSFTDFENFIKIAATDPIKLNFVGARLNPSGELAEINDYTNIFTS